MISKALRQWRRLAVVILWLLLLTPAAHALDPALAKQLADDDSDVKLEAISKIAASGDASAIPLLKAMQDDALQTFNGRLVIVVGSSVKDALSGEPVDAPADKLTAIIANNRVRGVLDAALAALKLVSPQREELLAAGEIGASDPDSAKFPLIKTSLAKGNYAAREAPLAQARAPPA